MIVYGISSDDVDATVPVIEAARGLTFHAHESSFRGGNCYRADTPNGEIILQSNCDASPAGQEAFEEDWPIDGLIIYFEGRNDTAWNPQIEVLSKLTDLNLTRLSRLI